MNGEHIFKLELAIGGRPVRLTVRIPPGPLTLLDLLPLAQGLTDLTVNVASEAVAASAREVRCGPRCGACCRQLVPISPPEALRLRQTLAALPPAHRARVQARFAAAARQLAASGLDARLQAAMAPGSASAPTRRALGLAYFAQGIACPFLEDESCSIHAERPLACREYLVTSAPAHCADPAAGRAEVVELPRRVSTAFAALSAARLQAGLAPRGTTDAGRDAPDRDPDRNRDQNRDRNRARDAAGHPGAGVAQEAAQATDQATDQDSGHTATGWPTWLALIQALDEQLLDPARLDASAAAALGLGAAQPPDGAHLFQELLGRLTAAHPEDPTPDPHPP